MELVYYFGGCPAQRSRHGFGVDSADSPGGRL